MSGHSKWSQIKHKKGANDVRRAKIFSKILKAIAAAARDEQNPDFNPRLRSIIETAKQNNVPIENVTRAIQKAKEGRALEPLIIEAYGPEKVALVIEVLTDNRNRTMQELRILLQENEAKIGEMGSARWAFNIAQTGGEWTPKFTQSLSDDGAEKLQKLIEVIEDHDDVQRVFENGE